MSSLRDSSSTISNKLYVQTQDQSWHAAEIVDINAVHDLAFLKVERTFEQPLPLHRGLMLSGSRIFSIGRTQNLDLGIVEGTLGE